MRRVIVSSLSKSRVHIYPAGLRVSMIFFLLSSAVNIALAQQAISNGDNKGMGRPC